MLDAGGLATATPGCATLPLGTTPEIQSVSPHISALDFQGLDMAFDIGVHNPYPIPIKSPRLRYGLLFPALGKSFERPVSHTGAFPVLRPPTFSDVSVDFANVSLLKMRINVNAMMKNPNVFAVGIENLGYTLKLGSVELGNLTATTAKSLDPGQAGALLSRAKSQQQAPLAACSKEATSVE